MTWPSPALFASASVATLVTSTKPATTLPATRNFRFAVLLFAMPVTPPDSDIDQGKQHIDQLPHKPAERTPDHRPTVATSGCDRASARPPVGHWARVAHALGLIRPPYT